MNIQLFQYAAVPAWPRSYRLRLMIYLLLSILAWLLPPWGALGALVLTYLIGRTVDWWQWFKRLGLLWLLIVAPLVFELIGSLSNQSAPTLASLFPAGSR